MILNPRCQASNPVWLPAYTVPNISEKILNQVSAILQENNWNPVEQKPVLIALREALANAIEHGNRYDESKQIFVGVCCDADRVELSVTDQGEGFEPPTLHYVDDPFEDGQGLEIIAALAERKLIFTHHGRTICFTIKRP